jgi:hypothetical protein
MKLPSSIAVALAFSFWAWAGTAGATATFPGVVATQLNLPAITIDPPAGCKLCHVNEAGGDPLSSFGSLMHSLGAVKYDEASVKAALSDVQAAYPQLITDIEQGIDPNTDTSVSGRPVPAYGCAVAPASPIDAAPGGAAVGVAFGLLASIGARRSRRSPRFGRSRAGR